MAMCHWRVKPTVIFVIPLNFMIGTPVTGSGSDGALIGTPANADNVVNGVDNVVDGSNNVVST